MSNQFYEMNWREAIRLIEESYSYEMIPLKENLAKKKLSGKRREKEWFKHYANLYIKYLHIMRILENCHENCNNPQKKQILKKMLDNILKRVLFVKRDLIRFNTHPKDINSDFINLQAIIKENDYTMDFMKVPIPRYFVKETNKNTEERKELLKNIFEEKEEEMEQSEEMKLFKREDGSKMTVEKAIEIIKRMELGRQGIEKGINEKNRLLEVYKKNFSENPTTETPVGEVITVIQKYIRGYFSRKTCHLKRMEEMKFLNFRYDQEKIKSLKNQTESIYLERQQKLKEMDNEIEENYFNIKKNLLENEGLDVKEKMLDERRRFIIEKFEEKNGKELPNDISEFYQQKEEKNEQKNDKDKTIKKGEAKNQSKKLTEEEMFLKERIEMGPNNSEELKNLIELIKKYFEDWGDQINQNENLINRDIIIKEIFPEIKKEIQEHVDKIVNIELQDLQYKLEIPKKKAPKPAKKVKVKKIKIPGENLVEEKDPITIGKELVNLEILRCPENYFFKTFHTTENIIRHLDEEEVGKKDPSLKQLKNLIKEQIVLTLGSGVNPEGLNRTFLFFGPEGTGKTHMLHSIMNDTNAVLLDISPLKICKLFANKNSITQIMYKVFFMAKILQPSVIFFDECEQFYAKKNLKKLKNFAGKCSKFKKDLAKQVNKHLTLQDKVVVIGATNKPKFVNMNETKKFFYKKFYFPFPDYSSRRFIFEKLLKNHIEQFKLKRRNFPEKFTKNVDISETFPYSILAFHSEGYSIGSFKKLIETVLSDERIERFEIMPLKIEELIDPLSSLDFCSAEEYQEFQDFGFAVNGIQEKIDKQKQILTENSKKNKK